MQLRNETSGLSGGVSGHNAATRLLIEHGWPAFSKSSESVERCKRRLRVTGCSSSSQTSNGPRILNRIGSPVSQAHRSNHLNGEEPIVITASRYATGESLEFG